MPLLSASAPQTPEGWVPRTHLANHPSIPQTLLEDLLWPEPGAGPQLETRLGALSPPPEELPVRWRGSCIIRKLWPGLISPWPRERHRNRTNHDVTREGSLEEGRFPLPRPAAGEHGPGGGQGPSPSSTRLRPLWPGQVTLPLRASIPPSVTWSWRQCGYGVKSFLFPIFSPGQLEPWEAQPHSRLYLPSLP